MNQCYFFLYMWGDDRDTIELRSEHPSISPQYHRRRPQHTPQPLGGVGRFARRSSFVEKRISETRNSRHSAAHDTPPPAAAAEVLHTYYVLRHTTQVECRARVRCLLYSHWSLSLLDILLFYVMNLNSMMLNAISQPYIYSTPSRIPNPGDPPHNQVGVGGFFSQAIVFSGEGRPRTSPYNHITYIIVTALSSVVTARSDTGRSEIPSLCSLLVGTAYGGGERAAARHCWRASGSRRHGARRNQLTQQNQLEIGLVDRGPVFNRQRDWRTLL